MSEGPNLVPGRARKRFHLSGPNNSLPAAHVDLGRTFYMRRSTRNPALHIVTRDGDDWQTLCTGAKAVRSFKGRPDQSSCSECKAACLRPADGAA